LNILRADWRPVLSLNSVIFGIMTIFLVCRAAAPGCALWWMARIVRRESMPSSHPSIHSISCYS